jgi:hypothetical protein
MYATEQIKALGEQTKKNMPRRSYRVESSGCNFFDLDDSEGGVTGGQVQPRVDRGGIDKGWCRHPPKRQIHRARVQRCARRVQPTGYVRGALYQRGCVCEDDDDGVRATFLDFFLTSKPQKYDIRSIRQNAIPKKPFSPQYI